MNYSDPVYIVASVLNDHKISFYQEITHIEVKCNESIDIIGSSTIKSGPFSPKTGTHSILLTKDHFFRSPTSCKWSGYRLYSSDPKLPSSSVYKGNHVFFLGDKLSINTNLSPFLKEPFSLWVQVSRSRTATASIRVDVEIA